MGDHLTSRVRELLERHVVDPLAPAVDEALARLQVGADERAKL